MDWLKQKPQRMRQNSGLRNLLRETRLCAANLVMPFFVVTGKNERQHSDGLGNVCATPSHPRRFPRRPGNGGNPPHNPRSVFLKDLARNR